MSSTKQAVNDPLEGRDLDARILEAALTDWEEGKPLDDRALLAAFPGQEAEVNAVVRAVSVYQARVERERLATGSPVTPDRPLPAGTVVGDFTIVGLLGCGAMGLVYRARQQSLGGREVALKVLPIKLVARNPRFIDRFKREASLAATIHHPHLAEVFGFESAHGLLCFAMRLVEGRTLHDILARLAVDSDAPARRATSQHVGRCVGLARSLAQGLAEIHAHGLVHRDVKPSNIMLEHASADDDAALTAHAVLIDFGLLRPAGSPESTSTDTLLGTPAYAAPECQLGRTADARADVFSLAATLHDLLTLTPPGGRQQASAGLPDVRTINPAVDARLAAILSMALQEKPSLRYANGAEFANELDRYLKNEPIRAFPTGSWGKLRLWSRRNPVAFFKAAAATGVFALILVAALTWVAITASRISNAAALGRRLEADGDLRGAGVVLRIVHDNRDLAAFLPWSTDDLTRASRYWAEDGVLRSLRERLEIGTEPSYAMVHDRVHELILDPALAAYAGIASNFLMREVATGAEHAWQRRLALETFQDLLLFGTASYAWSNELRSKWLEPITRGEEDATPDMRRSAAAALGSMLDARAFEALVPLIRAEDEELSRLAAIATERIWTWLHDDRSKGGEDVAAEPLAAWATAAYDKARIWREHGSAPWMAPDPLMWSQDVMLMVAADFQRASKINQDRMLCRLPDELASYVSNIAEALKNHRSVAASDPSADFLLPPPPAAWRGMVWAERRSAAEYRRATQPAYIWDYEKTLWMGGALSMGEAKPDPHGIHEAKVSLSFDANTPRLAGHDAVVASWVGAAHVDDGGANHFLKLWRPGASSLKLRARIPSARSAALVRLWHIRAARWPLPFAGRARVRVALQGTRVVVERDVPCTAGGDADPLAVQLARADFIDQAFLNVEVALVSANTTYRIYRLEIEWQER